MDWFCENVDWCSESERAEIAANNAPAVSAKLLQTARLARFAAEFLTDNNQRSKMLESASQLERIGNGINRLTGFHGNFEAVHGIYTVLEGITPQTLRENPQRAARAFGQLFVHAGTLAQHLPPPLNAYANFLLGAGDFFENIRDMNDPASPNTSHGRQMQDALRDISRN
jgi:hypothetical protein